ncbi:hypothetical protein [Pedobacter gandavensis]|uniref:hypothetical protein n=1 Tax=Pedobacter gandavensis TaxID=2679963 RepID=UPI0029312349|nr:hypothetical protein [Pedobacter gandavensis]
MKKHLISFGDGNYEQRIPVFKSVAIASSFFDTVTVYRAEDLDPEFVNRFYEVLKFTRGGGFIWKPYFIKKALEKIEDNDILIYCDAGCHINKFGKERFYQYLDLLNQSERGVLTFQMTHKEYKYTKREVFNYFGTTDAVTDSGQLVATIILLRKCDYSMRLVNLWNDAVYTKPDLFTDHLEQGIQHPDFIAHRHDQSIWSILAKTHGADIIPDETYFEDFGKDGIPFPLWAARIRR